MHISSNNICPIIGSREHSPGSTLALHPQHVMMPKGWPYTPDRSPGRPPPAQPKATVKSDLASTLPRKAPPPLRALELVSWSHGPQPAKPKAVEESAKKKVSFAPHQDPKSRQPSQPKAVESVFAGPMPTRPPPPVPLAVVVSCSQGPQPAKPKAVEGSAKTKKQVSFAHPHHQHPESHQPSQPKAVESALAGPMPKRPPPHIQLEEGPPPPIMTKAPPLQPLAATRPKASYMADKETFKSWLREKKNDGRSFKRILSQHSTNMPKAFGQSPNPEGVTRKLECGSSYDANDPDGLPHFCCLELDNSFCLGDGHPVSAVGRGRGKEDSWDAAALGVLAELLCCSPLQVRLMDKDWSGGAEQVRQRGLDVGCVALSPTRPVFSHQHATVLPHQLQQPVEKPRPHVGNRYQEPQPGDTPSMMALEQQRISLLTEICDWYYWRKTGPPDPSNLEHGGKWIRALDRLFKPRTLRQWIENSENFHVIPEPGHSKRWAFWYRPCTNAGSAPVQVQAPVIPTADGSSHRSDSCHAGPACLHYSIASDTSGGSVASLEEEEGASSLQQICPYQLYPDVLAIDDDHMIEFNAMGQRLYHDEFLAVVDDSPVPAIGGTSSDGIHHSWSEPSQIEQQILAASHTDPLLEDDDDSSTLTEAWEESCIVVEHMWREVNEYEADISIAGQGTCGNPTGISPERRTTYSDTPQSSSSSLSWTVARGSTELTSSQIEVAPLRGFPVARKCPPAKGPAAEGE
jgi:hypothetical protein